MNDQEESKQSSLNRSKEQSKEDSERNIKVTDLQAAQNRNQYAPLEDDCFVPLYQTRLPIKEVMTQPNRKSNNSYTAFKNDPSENRNLFKQQTQSDNSNYMSGVTTNNNQIDHATQMDDYCSNNFQNTKSLNLGETNDQLNQKYKTNSAMNIREESQQDRSNEYNMKLKSDLNMMDTRKDSNSHTRNYINHLMQLTPQQNSQEELPNRKSSKKSKKNKPSLKVDNPYERRRSAFMNSPSNISKVTPIKLKVKEELKENEKEENFEESKHHRKNWSRTEFLQVINEIQKKKDQNKQLEDSRESLAADLNTQMNMMGDQIITIPQMQNLRSSDEYDSNFQSSSSSSVASRNAQGEFKLDNHYSSKLNRMMRPKKKVHCCSRCMSKSKEAWSRFIFKPNAPFKIKWDLVIIILSIWNSIQIPLEFAFNSFDDIDTVFWLDIFVDCLFAIDILINFRTCYTDARTDDIIMDPKKIAKNYLQGRFWVDLLASLPLEVLITIAFQNSDQDSTTTLRFFGMMKLVRLLRLGRMVTYLKTSKNLQFGMKFVQLMFMLLLLLHWMSCFWYFAATLKTDINPEPTWIPSKDLDWTETIVFDTSATQAYNILFYYSCLALLGNDLVPTNQMEIMVATIIIFIGAISIGMLIGEFSSLIDKIDKRNRQSMEEYDFMSGIMGNLMIPEEIQQEIYDYYEVVKKARFIKDQTSFYDYMSQSLKQTIKMIQIEEYIRKISILNKQDEQTLVKIAQVIEVVFYLPDQIIIEQNAIPLDFFLIIDGIVEVSLKEEDNETSHESIIANDQQKEQLSSPVSITPKGSATNRKKSINKFGLKRTQTFFGGNESKSERPSFSFKNKKAKISTQKVGQLEEKPQVELKFNASTKFNSFVVKKKEETDLFSAEPTEEPVKTDKSQIINELKQGDYFGEIGLLTNLRRTCTCNAINIVTCGKISKENFLELWNQFFFLKIALEKKINTYNDNFFKFMLTMIRNVPAFRTVNNKVLRQIINKLHYVNYTFNSKVIAQGQISRRFYFVKEGSIEVQIPERRSNGSVKKNHHFCTLNKGSCFNFSSAFMSYPSIFNYVVTQGSAQLFYVDIDDFYQLTKTCNHLSKVQKIIVATNRKRHVKYDFSRMLFKDIQELIRAQKIKQEWNEQYEDVNYLLKRGKTFALVSQMTETERLNSVENKTIEDFEKKAQLNFGMIKLKFSLSVKKLIRLGFHVKMVNIFYLIDKAYDQFIGKVNIPLRVMIHNGVFKQAENSLKVNPLDNLSNRTNNKAQKTFNTINNTIISENSNQSSFDLSSYGGKKQTQRHKSILKVQDHHKFFDRKYKDVVEKVKLNNILMNKFVRVSGLQQQGIKNKVSQIEETINLNMQISDQENVVISNQQSQKSSIVIKTIKTDEETLRNSNPNIKSSQQEEEQQSKEFLLEESTMNIDALDREVRQSVISIEEVQDQEQEQEQEKIIEDTEQEQQIIKEEQEKQQINKQDEDLVISQDSTPNLIDLQPQLQINQPKYVDQFYQIESGEQQIQQIVEVIECNPLQTVSKPGIKKELKKINNKNKLKLNQAISMKQEQLQSLYGASKSKKSLAILPETSPYRKELERHLSKDFNNQSSNSKSGRINQIDFRNSMDQLNVPQNKLLDPRIGNNGPGELLPIQGSYDLSSLTLDESELASKLNYGAKINHPGQQSMHNSIATMNQIITTSQNLPTIFEKTQKQYGRSSQREINRPETNHRPIRSSGGFQIFDSSGVKLNNKGTETPRELQYSKDTSDDLQQKMALSLSKFNQASAAMRNEKQNSVDLFNQTKSSKWASGKSIKLPELKNRNKQYTAQSTKNVSRTTTNLINTSQ